MKAAITTVGLTKVYDKPQGWRRLVTNAPVTAVSQIDLTIPTGELFGLLGPNGAGKTTFVKMLCTLTLPSAGTATVGGHDLRNTGAIRAQVGLVVSDERSFYWRLSAQQNLEFFAALHGLYGAAAGQRIGQVLEAVDLQDVAQRRFSSFSSGMRQRLAIARALLHQPHILFLDEPSRSLDPTATQRLHELIHRLQQQRELTVFLITHDLAEAEKLCQRVALMHQGQIQVVGHPQALRRQLQPQQTYQLKVGVLEEKLLQQLQQVCPTLISSGQHLVFQASEDDALLTAVLDLLHQYHVTIVNIEATPPTLEEVFVHYTQHQG